MHIHSPDIVQDINLAPFLDSFLFSDTYLLSPFIH